MTTRTAAPSNDRETRSDNIGNTDNNGGQGPTPKLFIFSEEEVLRYGLEFVGFDEFARYRVLFAIICLPLMMTRIVDKL